VRIGIVSYWFNRGQATVARQLRNVLESAGHQAFVFARPTKESFTRLSDDRMLQDVWNQEAITVGKAYRPYEGEYLSWAETNKLDVVFFDQNYEFDQIRALRDSGIRTIGRFVWESFGSEHADSAYKSFSSVYSLTITEKNRYKKMGIESPFIPWGCHPELLNHRKAYSHDGPLVFLGGWMSARKPLGSVLEAHRWRDGSDTPLIVKTQRKLRRSDLLVPNSMDEVRKARRPPHEELPSGYIEENYGAEVWDQDIPFDEYLELLSGARALICPSRWEGLGLHFFEAMSLGIPVITSDIQPIREFVSRELNGILVSGSTIGQRKNGIPAIEPSIPSLEEAVRQLEGKAFAARLSAGMLHAAQTRSWSATEQGFAALLESCPR